MTRSRTALAALLLAVACAHEDRERTLTCTRIAGPKERRGPIPGL